MIFDVAGQRTLQRVPMLEPLKGTEAGVGELVRNAPDAASLLRALAAAGASRGATPPRSDAAVTPAPSRPVGHAGPSADRVALRLGSAPVHP